MSLKSSIKTVLTLGKGVASGLPEAASHMSPIVLFAQWLQTAEESSARMVLLKEVDDGGFVFYTNYGSRKAIELDANPHAALCIHWGVLQRQVRVEGSVERVSEEESADYFASRPRGTRLGAWASKQSQPLSERDELEKRLREAGERFPGDDVPLPTFWGGYRLKPDRIEFWQGRADRLHDRLVFTQGEDGWHTARLYP
jgi:pyridoxamine 5'-phosphate oxidase